MALHFDHVVVVTERIEASADLYRRVGLAVVPGGRHAGLPTQNALIPLQGGGYLELLASTRPALRSLLRPLLSTPLHHLLFARCTALERRFLRLVASPAGVADYCLWTDQHLDDVVAGWRDAGLRVDGPFSMGRTRPDGTRLEWRLAFPVGAGFPFVIEDLTPRINRLPAPEPESELAWPLSVHVAVAELERSVASHRLLLGMEPIRRGSRFAVFPLGTMQVVLEPHRAGSPLGTARLTLGIDTVRPADHAALQPHRIALVPMPRDDIR